MKIRPNTATRNEHAFEARESELDVRCNDPSAWVEQDSVYLADGRARLRLARLCGGARRGPAGVESRSFTIIDARSPHDEDVQPAARASPVGDMGACGRRYSLALLALLDALAAEPPRSPLATGSPLDDLRATAFLVAGATVASDPDLPLVERAVAGADRRLADLRVPLRATGYLAARDALRALVIGAAAAGDGPGRA